MRRPFFISALFGLGIILVSLVMLLTGPSRGAKLPDGYFTPIIAFEFATTPEDILTIFADADGSILPAVVKSITNNTYLDFLFLVVYGGFLLTFAWTCARLTANKLIFIAAGLAVLAPLFDILENIQLLAIMNAVEAGDQSAAFAQSLDLLGIFTWLKWGALAFYFLLLLPFLRDRGRYGRVLAIIGITPIILGIVALVTTTGLGKELFALSITIMFLMLIIFSFTYRTDVV